MDEPFLEWRVISNRIDTKIAMMEIELSMLELRHLDRAYGETKRVI